MDYDELTILDMVKVELCLDKSSFDQLMWLCKQINETDPLIVAEAILQVAIENTVNDPEQMDEWVRAFNE